MREERRLHHRYPVTYELRGTRLSPLEHGAGRRATSFDIRGVITDIGAGGLCLFSDDLIEISDPFVCEIIAPQMQVAIPTLLQNRWALRDGQGHTYRLGLQFLL